MNEEQKRSKSHSFLSGKFFKVLTLSLFFIIVLFSVGFLGLETTSSSQFCSSCHEMKPEYYTWKASSHSEVDCINCHTGTTKEDYAKAKANGLVQVYRKATNTYTAPIRMPDQIPDEACEKCHNLKTRDVTPTGDLIIPHDKHKEEGITCIKCHNGVAHGKIADRKMTFQTDYKQWDKKLGVSAMSDTKYIKPDMESCMKCHRARKVTQECSACHSSGMYPKSHNKEEFKLTSHGEEARKDLTECTTCHTYMSKDRIEGLEMVSRVKQYLQKDSQKPKFTAKDYAKQNTFCKDCHSQRPASHKEQFTNHGSLASENKEKCLTCHDNQNFSNSPVTKVTCASCHPSSHDNKPWRERHPIPISAEQKMDTTCYTCHSEPTCSSCHK